MVYVIEIFVIINYEMVWETKSIHQKIEKAQRAYERFVRDFDPESNSRGVMAIRLVTWDTETQDKHTLVEQKF